jgi:hypothetical protein
MTIGFRFVPIPRATDLASVHSLPLAEREVLAA